MLLLQQEFAECLRYTNIVVAVDGTVQHSVSSVELTGWERQVLVTNTCARNCVTAIVVRTRENDRGHSLTGGNGKDSLRKGHSTEVFGAGAVYGRQIKTLPGRVL